MFIAACVIGLVVVGTLAFHDLQQSEAAERLRDRKAADYCSQFPGTYVVRLYEDSYVCRPGYRVPGNK